jgi:integrase
MPLTDSAIKTAKPKEKPYKLSDAHGLYLEITCSGSKLWRLKYRIAGKEKKLALGPYPTVSLAQARQKREEARELLARESTRDKAKLYLEKDINSVIGARPVKTITRPELVELVRKVEARGALNVAGKIRQWLHQIFRFGLASGVVEANPATDLDVIAAPQRATRHHPHVTFAELPELLAKAEKANINALTRHAIRLLVLTAVRPGELRQAPWSEFDLAGATWTIPKERMKARRPHVVPLPLQAIAILRQLEEITGEYPLVFPGQNNSDRPMSDNTINKALRLMGYEGRQTGHGFRHLLSTELNGRGYNRDWIERQLAHGDNNEIRDTYNHANYLEQRREMMQAWADSIGALCAGANVVSIKRNA